MLPTVANPCPIREPFEDGVSNAPAAALALYRRAFTRARAETEQDTSPGGAPEPGPTYPMVSTARARAVATCWRPPSNAPRAVLETLPDASRTRQAVRLEAVEVAGCYAGIAAWTSREAWLRGLRLYLEHYPEALTSPIKNDTINIDTFMSSIEATVHEADPSTGRGIRVGRKKVAAAAKCDDKTVQRAWRIARRRLEVLVDVAHARPLTMEERDTVRSGHRMPDGTRCRQRGTTGLRAANTPKWLVPWIQLANMKVPPEGRPAAEDVDFVPRPRRGHAKQETAAEIGSLGDQSPVSLRSTRRTRSARRSDHARSSDSRPPRRARKARSRLTGEALVRDLARSAPWAARLSPRRSAPDFAPFEDAGWTAQVWLDVARAILTAPGRRPPSRIKAPFAFARWLCEQMVPDAPPLVEHVAVPVVLVACGGPRCDGAGWLLPQRTALVQDRRIDAAPWDDELFTISFVNDATYASPCPDCPPGIRSQLVDDGGSHHVDEDSENLF